MIHSFSELAIAEEAIANRDVVTLICLGIPVEKISQLFSIEKRLDESSRVIHATS